MTLSNTEYNHLNGNAADGALILLFKGAANIYSIIMGKRHGRFNLEVALAMTGIVAYKKCLKAEW